MKLLFVLFVIQIALAAECPKDVSKFTKKGYLLEINQGKDDWYVFGYVLNLCSVNKKYENGTCKSSKMTSDGETERVSTYNDCECKTEVKSECKSLKGTPYTVYEEGKALPEHDSYREMYNDKNCTRKTYCFYLDSNSKCYAHNRTNYQSYKVMKENNKVFIKTYTDDKCTQGEKNKEEHECGKCSGEIIYHCSKMSNNGSNSGSLVSILLFVAMMFFVF